MQCTAEWLFGAIYQSGGTELILYSLRIKHESLFKKISIIGVGILILYSVAEFRNIVISIFLPTPTNSEKILF